MSGYRDLYEQALPNCSYEPDLLAWELHYKNLLDQLDGDLQDKEATIRKRILRYFGGFKLDEDSYFSARIEGHVENPGVQPITNEIILYGVDYYSIERTKNYFRGFSTEIRRIDDSHFLVQFRNQDQALKGLIMNNVENLNEATPSQALKKCFMKWVKMKSYKQFVFERKLTARFRTNLDNFEFGCPNRRNSIVQAYSEAKKKFMDSLKLLTQDKEQIIKRQYSPYDERRKSKSSSRERSRQKQTILSCRNCRNVAFASDIKQVYNKFYYDQVRNSPTKNTKYSTSPRTSASPNKGSLVKKQEYSDEEILCVSERKFQKYIDERDAKKQKHLKIKKKQQEKDELFEKEKLIVIQPADPAHEINSSSIADFDLFLQKLKLGDSHSAEYSRFEYDMSR